MQTFPHAGSVTGAVFFESGDHIQVITASLDSTAKRWNLAGEVLTVYPNFIGYPLTHVEASPTQNRILFQTQDGDFMVTPEGDSLQGATDFFFIAYQPIYTTFSPSTQRERAVSLTLDRSQAFVWNFTQPEVDMDMQYSPKGLVDFTTFSPSGERILFSSSDNETTVFFIKRSVEEANVNLFRFAAHIQQGEFAPDNLHFISTDGDFTAQLWKFDADFVDEKASGSDSLLLEYYDQRIHSLRPEERAMYQLD